MSNTPSASPTPRAKGNCVICGEETGRRCSECAKYGTDWMFFCSIEHQKLIWSTHKRVCGVRSNPYHWPGFTDKEIEEMLELCVMPIQPVIKEGKSMKSWLEMMLGKNTGELPPIEAQLQAAQQSFEAHHEPTAKDRALPLAQISEIVSIRSNAYAFSNLSQDYLKRNPTEDLRLRDKALCQSPFDALAYTQLLLDYDLRRNHYFAPWWSEYQHKSLIHMYLFAETNKNPHSDEIWECSQWSRRDFIKFCEEVVKETHPKLAGKIINTLVDTPRYKADRELPQWPPHTTQQALKENVSFVVKKPPLAVPSAQSSAPIGCTSVVENIRSLSGRYTSEFAAKHQNLSTTPLISEAEAQFLAEISQKPSPDDDGVVRSWLDIIMGGIKPEDYAKLRSLRGYTRVEAFKMTLFRVGRDPAGGLRPLVFMTQRLQKLRLDSWKGQIRLAQTESGGRWRLWNEVAPEQSSSNPFGHLAHLLEDVQIPEFDENDKVYTSWWSRFHHLSLIRIAIASLLFDNPSDENTAFVEYTRRAVTEFVESTPSEVMSVVESYLRTGRTVGPT